jgi:hypothetical protein
VQEFAIRYIRRGRSFGVAKVFRIRGGDRSCYFRLRPTDFLRKFGMAISLAPEVAQMLHEEGIRHVHAFDRRDSVLYIADLETFHEKGIRASMHEDIGVRLHLLLRYWRRTRLFYHVPVIDEERIVQADEDETMPVQMALPLWK